MTTFNELMSAARELMKDVATGPTNAAFVIEKIQNNWSALREESGEKKLTTALTKTFGPKRGVQYFSKRRTAVAILGNEAKRILHHDAAVWASRKIPPANIGRFMDSCASEYVGKNYKTPLSKATALRVATQCGIVSVAEKQSCPRCKYLESEIFRLTGIGQAAE